MFIIIIIIIISLQSSRAYFDKSQHFQTKKWDGKVYWLVEKVKVTEIPSVKVLKWSQWAKI